MFRRDFLKLASIAPFLGLNTFIKPKKSEFEIWRDAEPHYKAIYPTISSNNGKCFIVSTPNGKGSKNRPNWFYQTYQDALKGNNQFKIFETNYKEHPEFNNKAWVKQTKKNIGKKGWRQEILAEFV